MELLNFNILAKSGNIDKIFSNLAFKSFLEEDSLTLNDNKTCRVVSYSNSYLQATFHSPVPPRDANKSDVAGLQGLKIYKTGVE